MREAYARSGTSRPRVSCDSRHEKRAAIAVAAPKIRDQHSRETARALTGEGGNGPLGLVATHGTGSRCAAPTLPQDGREVWLQAKTKALPRNAPLFRAGLVFSERVGRQATRKAISLH